jgi:hypothetical protein
MPSSKSTSRRSRADTLGPRELNRATLARQLLLVRDPAITPLAAIERLFGLQAQIPRPPFIGLWSRVPDFTTAALHQLVHDRQAVRASLMRGTIHLVSAADFLILRAALDPLLSAGVRRMANLDAAEVTKHARAVLPATFDTVRRALTKKFPKHDDRKLGYAARMHLPLVLVPTTTSRWAYPGNAHFHDAHVWLGRSPGEPSPATMIKRYLAAFGPASMKDAQAWSGLRNLGPLFDSLRSELRVFVDADGRELFDLPDAPRPRGDVVAPVRFLPEYDNLLLAYADHARMIDPARRPALTTNNGIVAATFLIDGRIAGTWSIARTKSVATLTLKPFTRLTKAALIALSTEGEALLRWHEPDASRFSIK